MEARVFGTGYGQNWRVTGFKADDPPGRPACVQLEFWIGQTQDNGTTRYRPLVPDSFDPDLARLLAKHLNEMADHAEEKNMSNVSIGADEIENRFGFHKATIEGENATLPIHRDLRLAFRDFAEMLDVVLPPGRAKSLAFTHLEDTSMRSHMAVALTAPVVKGKSVV